jgi:maltooligosyltrehalose trehalohydrolase
MKGLPSTPKADPEAKGALSVAEATEFRRRLPVGAEPLQNGGTHFRVWAPKSASVKVSLETGNKSALVQTELSTEPNGYFSGVVKEAIPGMLYRYKLESGVFPDPASRFQPQGAHGPSEIVDPGGFLWTDGHWSGVKRSGQVIYEMHIGTFTHAGTWAAARAQLDELAALGVTVIEVMPVAEFPGRFGWGYDGVDLFAPTRLYGQPDDFRQFVNRAHELGLGVILDVVYNHFGPDGNFLKNFSDHYFTSRYKNEWGEPINFDDEQAGPVREFFCANAAYWVDEFHLDGLRLDATQQIFDASEENIQAALTRHVRQAARGRSTLIVAENETQNARLVRSTSVGGYGLDALWNDDFHHAAVVALTGRAEAYYSDYCGTAQEFIAAIRRGFLYQGQFSRWQNKPRGSWSFDLAPDQFVNFLQNHDQIANSLSGARLHQLSSPGAFRAMTTLLLLGPATPMLFQGQEFAASAPFLYFADHHADLAPVVAEGRKEFLSQFRSIANPESVQQLHSPHAEETFARCKLDFTERVKNAGVYRLHRDLLQMRRQDPVFSKPHTGCVDGAALGPNAFVLRFFGKDSQDRLLFVNLGTDLRVTPVPEPLLAPTTGTVWQFLWSSESPSYGGSGLDPASAEQGWHISGQSACVFGPSRAGSRAGAMEASSQS